MKNQFSRASEKIRSHFFSRFFEIETLVNDCTALPGSIFEKYTLEKYNLACWASDLFSAKKSFTKVECCLGGQYPPCPPEL